MLCQTILISILTIAVAELACMGAYFYAQGKYVRPPYFGGPPVLTTKSLDGYAFNPLTIATNKDVRKNEGLFAKNEIVLPVKKGFRIFLVGGSTVANLRKPLGDRISDHLREALMKRFGQEVEVYNFGVPSFTSLNEMLLALTTLIYFQPDLIIDYDGVNDAFFANVITPSLWKPNITDLTVGYKYRLDFVTEMPPLKRVKYLLEGFSYINYFVDKFSADKDKAIDQDEMTPAEYSRLLDSQSAERIKTDPIEFAKNIGYPDTFSNQANINYRAVSVYLNNIRTIAVSLKASNIRFLHVLQPTAFTKKKLFPREAWSVNFNNAHYKDFQSSMIQTFDLFREGQKSLARDLSSRGTEFLDLSRLTDDIDAELYDDYCHASRNGELTLLVGNAIAEFIIESKMVR